MARKPAVSKKAPKSIGKEGQPQAARDQQRKPVKVISRRIRSAQRSAQQRQQKRRDSR